MYKHPSPLPQLQPANSIHTNLSPSLFKLYSLSSFSLSLSLSLSPLYLPLPPPLPLSSLTPPPQDAAHNYHHKCAVTPLRDVQHQCSALDLPPRDHCLALEHFVCAHARKLDGERGFVDAARLTEGELTLTAKREKERVRECRVCVRVRERVCVRRERGREREGNPPRKSLDEMVRTPIWSFFDRILYLSMAYSFMRRKRVSQVLFVCERRGAQE